VKYVNTCTYKYHCEDVFETYGARRFNLFTNVYQMFCDLFIINPLPF
jgi:hypothetical protein